MTRQCPIDQSVLVIADAVLGQMYLYRPFKGVGVEAGRRSLGGDDRCEVNGPGADRADRDEPRHRQSGHQAKVTIDGLLPPHPLVLPHWQAASRLLEVRAVPGPVPPGTDRARAGVSEIGRVPRSTAVSRARYGQSYRLALRSSLTRPLYPDVGRTIAQRPVQFLIDRRHFRSLG
ncbi:hypothetical protein Franean1_3094 [Parafrankia sp. EAN1pec]|nr:hypothetical protein Franean1_3094 [Frankia sp. EAN1pec]